MFTGCTACLPGVLLCTGLGVNVYRVYCMFTGCTAMYRTRSRYLPGVLHVYRVYCYVQDSESIFTGCTACLPGVLLCTGLGVDGEGRSAESASVDRGEETCLGEGLGGSEKTPRTELPSLPVSL